MTVIQTRRGPLVIAASRTELDTWPMSRCLQWLLTNDPNGECSNYIRDFAWAVENCGALSANDARDAVWDQMEDS